MTRRLILAGAALGVAWGAALAQAPGTPLDPNRLENRQPAPSPRTPTDPAAESTPAARVPTAPIDTEAYEAYGADEGVSAGEEGLLDYPAGLPGDPNSTQNRQPAPSPLTPTDPATESNPTARVPTIP